MKPDLTVGKLDADSARKPGPSGALYFAARRHLFILDPIHPTRIRSGAAARLEELADLPFNQGFPTRETAARVHDEQDQSRAMEAYRFFYPTVSMEGILQGTLKAGVAPNTALVAFSTGPRHVVFTGNSDTPYGSAILDLKAGPMVIEVPAGGYIGLLNDHNQRWIQDLGIPGPDGGKGGRYLLLPPGHKLQAPPGFIVSASPTFAVLMAVRAIPAGGDIRGALQTLGKIAIYPLSRADRPPEISFMDATDRTGDFTCLKWEDNILFWEHLHAVLEEELLFEEFRPMYGLLATLGIEKGRRFAPDDRMKGILAKAAKAARDQMLVEAFASTRPERMAWKDRRWEWVGLQPENGDFETPTELDVQARERWFAQAIVVSPAMFRRKPGTGSLYWLGHRDKGGAYLDGSRNYVLKVPQPVPASLFWSVTVYDSKTRSQIATSQDKAALRSLVETFVPNADGSIDLHFGPREPEGRAGQWIKTSPGEGWFAYFRVYGPEAAAFDGTWKPGDFEPSKA